MTNTEALSQAESDLKKGINRIFTIIFGFLGAAILLCVAFIAIYSGPTCFETLTTPRDGEAHVVVRDGNLVYCTMFDTPTDMVVECREIPTKRCK